PLSSPRALRSSPSLHDALPISVGVVLYVIWVARHVLSWLLISLFLALALNPAVEWLQRHGVPSRGLAAGITFLVALGLVGGLLRSEEHTSELQSRVELVCRLLL